MQLELYQSPNNKELRVRFVDLMKRYDELSETGRFDFHRRLDRLNFLIFEINRQNERKSGFELLREMSGKSIKRNVIFLSAIWVGAKILGYLEVWHAYEGSDYVLSGILLFFGFVWLGLEKPRIELEIDKSLIRLGSVLDEWSVCTNERLGFAELELLNEEQHEPMADNDLDAYLEEQERLNIRTLENLISKVRHIGGIAEEL